MTAYSITPCKIYPITPDNPGFQLVDNLTVSNRAGFEITADCPRQYANIVAECFNQGWLKPVAYITEDEKLFIGLTK